MKNALLFIKSGRRERRPSPVHAQAPIASRLVMIAKMRQLACGSNLRVEALSIATMNSTKTIQGAVGQHRSIVGQDFG